MKLSDYMIIFAVIAVCFGFVTFANVDILTKANTSNSEYTSKLLSACYDAAQSMDAANIEQYGCVWNNKRALEETLDTFYTSLAFSFGYGSELQKNKLTLFTPVVCLVDVNGYYISTNEDLSSFTVEPEWTNCISHLHTWSRVYGDVNVRYFLHDEVEVWLGTTERYIGNRKTIRQEIRDDFDLRYNWSDPGNATILAALNADLNAIQFIEDDAVFQAEKNEIIIREINQQCEYYVNQHNLVGAQYDLQYHFSMPEVAGEDWARLLTSPTVISFLQGYSEKTEDGMINIYSLGGGELITTYHYFVTDLGTNPTAHCIESELHRDGSALQEIIDPGSGRITYQWNGVPITEIFTTQTECLRMHPEVAPHTCIYNLNRD